MRTSTSWKWHPRWVLPVILTVCGLALTPGHAIQRKPSLEAKDHPEVVLVTARSTTAERGGQCTGVLIGPRAVLTAAHSAVDYDVWEVTAPYAKKGPAKAVAKTARVHPEYKTDKVANDLAVLLLAEAIDIGQDFPALHGGDLYPIETKLVVIGRVCNGALSRTQLFKTAVTRVTFPGNVNVYGGNPHVVEEGDSGGPVYVRDKPTEVAGLVSGNIGTTRSNVRTDLFIPIYRRNQAWIVRQLPSP